MGSSYCRYGNEFGRSGNAKSSICPKGWRLPTDQELVTLAIKYDYNQAQTGVPNFGQKTWAGTCFYGCASDQGDRGYWWSSTAGDAGGAFLLHSYYHYFNLGGNYKGYGNSVRCVKS